MATIVVKVDGSTRSDVTFEGFEWNALDGFSASFSYQARHDQSPAWLSNNNLMEVYIDSVRRFYGWLRVNEPGGIAQERVTYSASDVKARLTNEEYVQINGSFRYVYNPNGEHDSEAPGVGFLNYWSVGEILVDLLEHALGYPAGGSAIPTHHDSSADITDTYLDSSWIASYDSAVLLSLSQDCDEIDIEGSRFGELIDELLAFQGDCFWYIDPATLAFVVHKLGSSSAVSVRVGELGHHADESGKNYDVEDNPIQLDLSETYTHIILEGRPLTEEIRPAGLDNVFAPWPPTGLGDAELEPVWTAADAAIWNSTDYYAGLYDGTSLQWVYRLFRAKNQTDRVWRKGTISPEGTSAIGSGAVFVTSGGNLLQAKYNAGPYSIYHSRGEICFADPLAPYWRAQSYYFWARVEHPFRVEVGPAGASAYTNYGITSKLVFINDEWWHPDSSWGDGISKYDYGRRCRDDRPKMTSWANQLQSIYGKERMSSEITVDGIDVDRYNLTKKINFDNLTASKWSGVNLQVGSIVVDPAGDRMSVSCGNRLDGIMRDSTYVFRVKKSEVQNRTGRQRANLKIQSVNRQFSNQPQVGE